MATKTATTRAPRGEVRIGVLKIMSDGKTRTAGDVARELNREGTGTGNAMNVLDSLVAQGFARLVSEAPKTYKATAAGKALLNPAGKK